MDSLEKKLGAALIAGLIAMGVGENTEIRYLSKALSYTGVAICVIAPIYALRRNKK